MTRLIGYTLLFLLALLQTPTLNAATCQSEPFANLPRDQARLERGSVGVWRDDFEQTMVTIEDIDGNPWQYFTLQKKPANAEPKSLVLFLHGFPEFSWAWEKQLAAIGENTHAVAIDLKGHHYSSAPDNIDEYHFLEIAWEIRALIKCLGYEKATLVGQDFGGAIAWTMGMLHPDMVEGLVILNAPHPYLFGRELLSAASEQNELSRYIGYAQGTGIKDNLDFTFFMMSDTSILQNDFYRGKRFFRLLNENWLPTSRWKTMKHFYRAMPFPASEGDFPATLSTFQKKIYTVRAPTLVLWGMKDPYFTPHLLDGMDALVPNLEVVRYPEATHWIHHEIDDLNEQIQRFLARLPSHD